MANTLTKIYKRLNFIIIFCPDLTSKSAAPITPPMHWAIMYKTLAINPIFLPTNSPIVTAGLIWHPDT